MTKPKNHEMVGVEIRKVRTGYNNSMFVSVKWESTRYPGRFVSTSEWVSTSEANALIAELAG